MPCRRRVGRIVTLLSIVLIPFVSAAPSLADGPPDPATEPIRTPGPVAETPRSVPATEPSDSENAVPRSRRNLFGRVLGDQKYLFKTWWPSEFHRPLFVVPLVASAVAGAAGDERVDVTLEQSLHGSSEGGGHAVATFFTDLGDGTTAAVLIGGTYLISRWTHKDRMTEATSLAAEALLNAGIYSTAIKLVTGRERPHSGPDAGGDFFQYQGYQPNSFPSGHAMGAFAVATVFAEQYRGKRWVPWLAYGTATLIAGSRMVLGRHFPSDVIFGAVLGHSLGEMVMTRAHGDRRRRHWNVEPTFDPRDGGYGVSYSYSW